MSTIAIIKVPAATKRSPLLVALVKRHSRTQVMKDRRNPRGGSRNNQRDYREEKY
jgi:hypothetical protein